LSVVFVTKEGALGALRKAFRRGRENSMRRRNDKRKEERGKRIGRIRPLKII